MPDFECPKCKNKIKNFSYNKMLCTKCQIYMVVVQETSATTHQPLGPSQVRSIPPKRPPPQIPTRIQGVQPQPSSEIAKAAANIGKNIAARTQAPVAANRNLIFTMSGGTNLNVDTPLKYVVIQQDISLQSGTILVKLPIKVHSGQAAVTYWKTMYSEESFFRTSHGNHQGVQAANVSDDVLNAWTKKINSCWGAVGLFYNNRTYKLDLKFELEDDPAKSCGQICAVKTTGQALTTNPTGTIDAIRWGVDDIDTKTTGPVCHEVGHYLGCPDEYFTIQYEGRTQNWGNGYTMNAGIMNNPDEKPKLKHYRPIYRFVAEQVLKLTALELANCRILPDISFGPNQKGAILLANHIWDPETQPPKL
jgi:hypothetical protein